MRAAIVIGAEPAGLGVVIVPGPRTILRAAGFLPQFWIARKGKAASAHVRAAFE